MVKRKYPGFSSSSRPKKVSRSKERYYLFQRAEAVSRLRAAAARGRRPARLALAKIKSRSWANLRKLYWSLVARKYLRSWARRVKSRRVRSKRQVYPRHWGVGVY